MALLILVSVCILVVLALMFFLYKYAMHTPTYEEAQAEYKKQRSAFLSSNKPKIKEKKSNKVAKKLQKEKAAVAVVQDPKPSEKADEVDSIHDSTDSKGEIPKSQPPTKSGGTKGKASNKQSKTHVEFKEQPEEVPVEISADKEVKEVINKKRVKKVRPILVKKSSEQELILPAAEVPIANHFEEIHPKDEFELLRANSKEDVHKQESPREEKKADKPSKKNKHQKQDSPQQQVEKVEKNEAAGEPAVEKEKPREEKAIENTAVVPVQEAMANTGKEKKKKKSEFNSRQQLTAERDQLFRAVRVAELSRTEVQELIDLLLNKQSEAPTVVDDWSEGKSDPVQKLKKQLAEKEKQVTDLQDALSGVQTKLKEVRSEQTTERAVWQQKYRTVEEFKVEIEAANNRLRQKVQELEERCDKNGVNIHQADALINNLKAENAHLTNQMQLLTQERQEHINILENNYMVQMRTLEGNHAFALQAQQEETRNIAEQLKRATDTFYKEEQNLKAFIAQLQEEIQQLRDENKARINGSQEEHKEHEVKILNLSNELASAKSELSSVKKELSSVTQTLSEAEKQYKTELSSSRDKLGQLQKELEEQKNKNNELRKKNWKVMEALNAAESRHTQANKVDVDLLASEIKTKEQNAQKEFIQRLFPEIATLKAISGNEWQGEYEKAVRQHVSTLQRTASGVEENAAEVARLQTDVQRYKKIIDDTEKILKDLQSNIEQEERNWRIELAQKEAEIQELKNKTISTESQLQMKLSTLESQLLKEQIEKQRLLEERHHSLNRSEVKSVHADSTATIERLSEEIDRMKEQIKTQQAKNSDTNLYQNGETS